MPRLLPQLLALLAVFIAFAVAIAWYGAMVPPYVGDLTRLGGYSEHDFVWRDPQARFDPPLYRAHSYDAPADVLILGDSMSLHRRGEQTDPGTYWPNEFARQTGWRVSAVHRNLTPVDEVVASIRSSDQPPRLLVLQIAERAMGDLQRIAGSYASHEASCTGPARIDPPRLPPPRPLEVAPEPLTLKQPSRTAVDFSRGAHHLKRRLLPWSRDAVHFELVRGDLFSNRRSRELLVYADDLLKQELTSDAIRRQACTLLHIQRSVEFGGLTLFVALIVPDKLSAYRPYLVAPPEPYPAIIPLIAKQPGLRLVRVDLAFASALESGVVDLFMPNDTHPGIAGHRRIAIALIEELAAAGVIGGDSLTVPADRNREQREQQIVVPAGAEHQ